MEQIARGVGNIENINDILVADRMKKRVMSWSIHGADHLIQVRASIQNGEWEDVCQWVLRQAETVEKRSEQTKERKKAQRGRRKTGQLREANRGMVSSTYALSERFRAVAEGIFKSTTEHVHSLKR